MPRRHPVCVVAGFGACGVLRFGAVLGPRAATHTHQQGWTALHWASFHGNLSGVVCLVELDGALLSLKDAEGKTALDLAREEHASAVKDLEGLREDPASGSGPGAEQAATKAKQVATKEAIVKALDAASNAAAAAAGGSTAGLQEID